MIRIKTVRILSSRRTTKGRPTHLDGVRGNQECMQLSVPREKEALGSVNGLERGNTVEQSSGISRSSLVAGEGAGPESGTQSRGAPRKGLVVTGDFAVNTVRSK
jgi:hypothetical protein